MTYCNTLDMVVMWIVRLQKAADTVQLKIITVIQANFTNNSISRETETRVQGDAGEGVGSGVDGEGIHT